MPNARRRTPLTERITDLMLRFDGRKRFLLYAALLLLVTLPPALLFAYSRWTLQQSLTELVYARRQALANVAATLVQERLDGLVNLGTSLATRVQFRQLIDQGLWEDAVQILRDVTTRFPIIERVFIVDPAGIMRADVPAIPGVHGVDFSFRDWYRDTAPSWKPTVSNVYRRTAEPQYNVILVTSPISSTDGRRLGILGLQIKLDQFADWTREIDKGGEGFAYIVDRAGQLVVHPSYSPQGEIVSFAELPHIQAALAGKRGIGVVSNTFEKTLRLSAWEPVPKYGWAVVIAQPAVIAFASIREGEIGFTVVSGVMLAAFALLVLLLILQLAKAYELRQKDAIVMSSIGDGVAVIDRDFRLVYLNRAAEQLTGWNASEAKERKLFEALRFLREDDGSLNVTFIEEAMLFGEVRILTEKTVLRRKDGTDMPVSDSAGPIKDAAGRVTGAIVVFRDVSKERELLRMQERYAQELKQRLAEQTRDLRESEDRLRFLSDATPEGIVVHEQGKIIDANQTWMRMFGYSMKDMRDRDLIELIISPDEREKVRQQVRMGSEQTYEVTAVRKDGRRFLLEVTPRNIEYKGRRVRIALVRDITERKKREGQIHELNELKNRFIQVVSHQLRTPLNSIRWNLESLLTGQLGALKPSQREFVHLTYEAELGVIKRIHDLLVALDIEEGKIRLRRERVSFLAVATSAFEQWKNICELKKLSCTFDAPSVAISDLVLDREKIRETIDQLIDNAVSFTPDGGEVRLRIVPSDGSIRFEVSDTGIGIPEDEQSHIFTRFYRASNAARMKTDASGLGLAIAKYYVEQHGGSIGFTSKEGKGSTFWIDLPLEQG